MSTTQFLEIMFHTYFWITLIIIGALVLGLFAWGICCALKSRRENGD